MRVQLCYRIFLTCNIFLVNAYANWLPGSDSLYRHVIPGSQYSKAWGKCRILVELNSSNLLIWFDSSIHRLQVRLTKSGNATVVRRWANAVLNNQLQNNLSKGDGLRKRHKNYDSLICQTVFPPPPPDEHALYKDNFASGNGEQVDTNKFLIALPGG